jgi:hypothetical protein
MKLHSKKDIYYIYKYLCIALIPLIIFGIIKNGLYLTKETTDKFIILKPLIYLVISLLLGFILDYIHTKKIKPNKYLISLLLFYMISSINTPIWLFILGNILLILFIKFDKYIINKVSLASLIVLGIMYILKINNYNNIIENSGKYLFSFMDLLIKGQVGGISSCNLILVIISFISLLTNVFYKKNLALISTAVYLLSIGILSVVTSNSHLNLLINSTVIFELIMILTINNYSPRTLKGEITYGIITGILSAILCNYLSFYAGALIAITILSPLHILFDKNKLFR